jgi:hypothetical protein
MMPPYFRYDGSDGRAFTARTEGQDRLTVRVYDPVANVTIEATATIDVTPAPLLEKVLLYPEEATVKPGGEVYLSAQAVDGIGEAVGAVFQWVLTEGLGEFREPPSPLMASGVAWPFEMDRPLPWPWPPEGYDFRILVASDQETQGTVVVTASQPETGRTASAKAAIQVVAEQ